MIYLYQLISRDHLINIEFYTMLKLPTNFIVSSKFEIHCESVKCTYNGHLPKKRALDLKWKKISDG